MECERIRAITSAPKIALILGRRCVLSLSLPLLLHSQRSRIEPFNVCMNPRLLSLLLNLSHLTLRKGRQKFVVLTGLDLLKRHLEVPRFYSLYGNFEWTHPILLFQHDTFCAPLVGNETVEAFLLHCHLPSLLFGVIDLVLPGSNGEKRLLILLVPTSKCTFMSFSDCGSEWNMISP